MKARREAAPAQACARNLAVRFRQALDQCVPGDACARQHGDRRLAGQFMHIRFAELPVLQSIRDGSITSYSLDLARTLMKTRQCIEILSIE